MNLRCLDFDVSCGYCVCWVCVYLLGVLWLGTCFLVFMYALLCLIAVAFVCLYGLWFVLCFDLFRFCCLFVATPCSLGVSCCLRG